MKMSNEREKEEEEEGGRKKEKKAWHIESKYKYEYIYGAALKVSWVISDRSFARKNIKEMKV